MDFTLQRCGSLDVLVNNVGGAPRTDAATASPRFSEAIKHLNLLAPLNFSQVANRVMQGQEDGDRIINSASVSTLRPALLPTVPPRPVEPICAGMGSRYTPPIT